MDVKQTKLLEQFENYLLNEGAGEKRINKFRSMFVTLERGLPPHFDKLTKKQVEKFINDLHRDKFRKINGEKYSGASKSDIKKSLKQFYVWYRKTPYPPETAWIKGKIRKEEKPEEKPTLTIEEAQKLAHSFNKIDFRIITLALFDSGFRISEMLSVTKEDITWEPYDSDDNKCFWIQCRASKTIERKVPIPLFTSDIDAYFNSSDFKLKKATDPAFSIDYDYYRKKLKENSKKLFGKKINPHCLRHSSATYYSRAFEGNINHICDRYGWSYSSKQAATYIRKSGAYQKIGVKKVYNDQSTKLKMEIQELRTELIEQKKQMNDMIQAALSKMIKSGEIEAALQRKKQ